MARNLEKQIKVKTLNYWVNKPIKGTLMQIWKSVNILVFIWKYYVEDFTLKHLLFLEMSARETCEKFVYKDLEITEYLEN